MKIKDVSKVCIVDIEGNSISEADLIELKRLFKLKAEKKRIGIDLRKVLYLKPDFLDFLYKSSKKQKLSIFNANNEVYLMLFISRCDKYVNIYLNEDDFYRDKNCIVYRRLKLLKTA